jgi:exodeoxyribonuclease III
VSPHQRKQHFDMVQTLREQFGIVSAYHAFHGVEHGEELHPTHYWRRDEDERWHIDFCFVPHSWAEKVQSVDVGGYAEWKDSDHRPLTVDVAV